MFIDKVAFVIHKVPLLLLLWRHRPRKASLVFQEVLPQAVQGEHVAAAAAAVGGGDHESLGVDGRKVVVVVAVYYLL